MVNVKALLSLSVLLMANLSLCELPIPMLQRSVRSAPDECSIADPSDFKFSITSNRNKTGHWTAQVSLEFKNGHQGYELAPGLGYYKFHTTPKVWDDAKKICEQEGGHLAIINSEAESKVLQNLFSKVAKIEGAGHNDFAFIGIHDNLVEGEFVTVFGTPVASTGFTRWTNAAQPDNAGGHENCGSVHRDGSLNDITCSWKLTFFCEMEL
ncbi:hypothetical protein ANN_13543 [Periplaneta americana]|uniref:C-type lectin domain-containing protein n=1 Tax=Periplaneta americana TaxID=6978 RepID=A0ABQ8TJV7_PERAM|nr:hypothetical protein ANN_13543 [Periplaneta americana]